MDAALASDEELAARYRRDGDQEVLGSLYARYLELLYGLCLSYLHDVGRAEDATMDIYEQLVTKLRQHHVEAFRPWVYRLARNHCLMLLRRTASGLTLHSQSVSESKAVDLADVQLADLVHLDDDVHQREANLNALEDCRSELNARQAACIRRFYLEGESYAHIAESEALPLNSVRSAIQNGRRNLRRCIERTLQTAQRS